MSCKVLPLLLLCFVTQSLQAGDRKVVVGYYGESLCPDCVDFSNGPLTDAFDEVCSMLP